MRNKTLISLWYFSVQQRMDQLLNEIEVTRIFSKFNFKTFLAIISIWSFENKKFLFVNK